MRRYWIFKGVVFFAAAFFVMGFAAMWLWNQLVPELFHGPFITFWQAFGLVLLSRILFRGFFGMRGGHGWRGHHWGQHWRERWEKMTPEQREEIRKRWGNRCGGKWMPEEDVKTSTV